MTVVIVHVTCGKPIYRKATPFMPFDPLLSQELEPFSPDYPKPLPMERALCPACGEPWFATHLIRQVDEDDA